MNLHRWRILVIDLFFLKLAVAVLTLTLSLLSGVFPSLLRVFFKHLWKTKNLFLLTRCLWRRAGCTHPCHDGCMALKWSLLITHTDWIHTYTLPVVWIIWKGQFVQCSYTSNPILLQRWFWKHQVDILTKHYDWWKLASVWKTGRWQYFPDWKTTKKREMSPLVVRLSSAGAAILTSPCQNVSSALQTHLASMS